MQWKFSLGQKIRIGATLVVVFLVVLATNLMDNRHFADVQKSLITVYEDRLVAKDYIYKISKQLQLKRSAYQHQEKEQLSKQIANTNDSIQSLTNLYAATKLTPKEAYVFKSFQSKLKKLQHYETRLLKNNTNKGPGLLENETEEYILALSQDLDALSEIQLMEGKREINASSNVISTSNFISRLEIGALTLIGFLLLMLIFAKSSKQHEQG